MDDLTLIATVDSLTQELLTKLRQRCTEIYAAFAGVIDRLRTLSMLLLDRGDLTALVEGDQAIMMLLDQLNKTHLLRGITEDSSRKETLDGDFSPLRALIEAPARSQLAFQAHQHIDDLTQVFLADKETSDADWKTQWESDCNQQLRYFKKLLENEVLQHAIDSLSVNQRHEMARELQCWIWKSSRISVGEHGLLQKILSLLGNHGVHEPDPEEERPQIQVSSEDDKVPPLQEELRLMQWQPQRRRRRMTGLSRRTTQKEFIPAHEVNFQTSWMSCQENGGSDLSDSASGSLFLGSWLDTTVSIQLTGKTTYQGSSGEVKDDEAIEMFNHQVRTWFRLDHPNVLKLFGGCDDALHEIDVSKSPVAACRDSSNLRFFVCEHARDGTLRQFLKHHDKEPKSTRMLTTWTKLYEAALGLKYLHQRGIVHGRLRCREILVGNDGQAKLTVFGSQSHLKSSSTDSTTNDSHLRWTAPERLGLGHGGESVSEISPTAEADVFALGMSILEAATMRAPWKPLTESEVSATRTSGSVLPPRPEGSFTDDQWDLLVQMCSSNPHRRPNISSVVHCLETVVEKAAATKRADLKAHSHKPTTKNQCAKMAESHDFESKGDSISAGIQESTEAEIIIPNTLSAVQSMVGTVSESSAMNKQLCARIIDIYNTLLVAASPWSAFLVDDSAKPRQGWIRAAQHYIHEARKEKTKKKKASQRRRSVERFARWILCAPLESQETNTTFVPAPLSSSTQLSFEDRRQALDRLAKVVKEFHQSLLVAVQEPAISLTMLCASRTKVAQEVYEYHAALDRLLDSTTALNTTRIAEVHQWQGAWEEQRSLQVNFVARHKATTPGESLTEGQRPASPNFAHASSADTGKAATTTYLPLRTRQRGITTPQVSPRVVLAKISSAWNVHPIPEASNPLPEWFLPPGEVLFDPGHPFTSGAFGRVHKGKWLDSHVVVKNVIVEQDENLDYFRGEVAIWYSLNHPHIVNLFGACHLGRKPFFVCEDATLGRLDSYLGHRRLIKNKVNVTVAWRKLYEAALGLQYLHERGIIHQDLKCDNILVGNDERAKLADFGLSTNMLRRNPRKTIGKTSKPMGALRWKAPELLIGGKMTPSMEADIFAFGMCIVQAVSGELPWGKLLPELAVAHQIKKGILPAMPKAFTPSQWKLVMHMCAFDPHNRPSISTVVKALGIIVSCQTIDSMLYK